MGCQGGEKTSGGRQGGSSSPSMKRSSLQGFSTAQRLQVHRRVMNEGFVSHLTINRKVNSSRSSPTGIVSSGLTKRTCQTGGHSPSHVFETVHGRATTCFANLRQKSKTSSPALWPSLSDKKLDKNCIPRKPIKQTKPDLGIISEDKEEEEKEDTHVSPIKLAWVRRFAQNPSVRMRNKFRNRLSTIREECLSTLSTEVTEDSLYKIREDVCVSREGTFSKLDAVQDLCYSKATTEQWGRRSFKRSPSKEKRTIWGDTILAEETESSDKENVESENELDCSKAGRSVCLSGEYGLADTRLHYDMYGKGTHSAFDRKYVSDGEKFNKKLGFLSHPKFGGRMKKLSRHYSGDVSAKNETGSCRIIPIKMDTNVMRDSFEKQLELIKSLGIDDSDDMTNLEPDALSDISQSTERDILNINTPETDTCTNVCYTEEISSSEQCLQKTSHSLSANNEAHGSLGEFGLATNVTDQHSQLPCNVRVRHCETSFASLTELSEDESEVNDTQNNNQIPSGCIQPNQVQQHDGLPDNGEKQADTVNNICELTDSADSPSQTDQQNLTDQAIESAILGSSSVNIEATPTAQVIEVTENNNISEVVSATNYDCSQEDLNLSEWEAAEANTQTTSNGQKPISQVESVDGYSISRVEDEKHEDSIYETPSDRLKTSDEHKPEINHPRTLFDLCASITCEKSLESDNHNKDKGFDICIGAADDVCLSSIEGTHSLHTSTFIKSTVPSGQTETISRELHHNCSCPCFYNNYMRGSNPPTQPENNFLYLQKKLAEKSIRLQSTVIKGGKLVCTVQVAKFDDSDHTVVWGIFSGKSWGNICSVKGRRIVPELSRTNVVYNERLDDIYIVEYDIDQGLNDVGVIVICENQGQQFCDDNYGRPYKINVCNFQQLS